MTLQCYLKYGEPFLWLDNWIFLNVSSSFPVEVSHAVINSLQESFSQRENTPKVPKNSFNQLCWNCSPSPLPAPRVEVPEEKMKTQKCWVLGVYRPLQPKSAIPHPITIQNLIWTIEKKLWTIPLSLYMHLSQLVALAKCGSLWHY